MLAIFLDTETNGLNPFKHDLLEIAFVIVDAATGERLDVFQAILQLSATEWAMSDSSSLKVNAFTWEEIAHGQSKEEVATAIETLFKRRQVRRGQAVFICQNPSFDRAFFNHLFPVEKQEILNWPYHWLDLASMYWIYAISQGKNHANQELMPWVTGYSKDKIAVSFGLPHEEKPHRAMNGVLHLLLCYEHIVGFPGQV